VQEPQVAMNVPIRDRAAMQAPMPASAPAERFEAARKSTVQRDAQTLGALDKIQLNEIVVSPGGPLTSDSMSEYRTRRGGDHLFHPRNGTWIDDAFKDGTKIVKIKPFSPAYFKVLDAIPELRESFAVGQKVLVTGKHIAIEISDAGVEKLGDAELRSLKEQW
jgi:hypothetical protein